MHLTHNPALPLILSLLTGSAVAAETQRPDALAAPGETAVLTLHAQGEQIYECKEGGGGKLRWTFREPVATLIADGKVAGHHSAGPTWELADGSAVVGKVVASAPGRSANDIPWLKLEVISHRGKGKLSDITTVQRINTVGGKLEDACERPGNTEAMPYAADYL